jgi:hypothetical protein
MRITNELRSYVNSRIDAIIPEPSKDDLDRLNKFVESVKLDFEKVMSGHIQKYIDKFVSENPDFVDCGVCYNVFREPTLGIAVHKHRISKEYNRQIQEYASFKQSVVEKCIALLSVQKEVEDLDTFIANVVASVK